MLTCVKCGGEATPVAPGMPQGGPQFCDECWEADENPTTGLPTAYTVAELRGRYYPMRFGAFRFDGGRLISFQQREVAEMYCWYEQREYTLAYPTNADVR